MREFTWSGMAIIQELESIVDPFTSWNLAGEGLVGLFFLLGVCPSPFPESGRQQVCVHVIE